MKFTDKLTNYLNTVIGVENAEVSQKVSRDYVAKQMCVSYSTMKNRLKEDNTTFKEVLEDIRITTAKSLLRQRYKVSRVTTMLGFTTRQGFIAMFKRRVGTCPVKYRMEKMH